MSPEVGVVIPAYNAAAFIGQALDSVAAQTLLPTSVTVVDDGSSDGTADVVRAWMRAHPGLPVTLLNGQTNRHIARARNRAIAATPTELIATLDADDLFQPMHLERTTEPLTREPEIVLAFGDTQEFSEAGDLPETFLTRVGGALRALEAEERNGYRVLGGAVFGSLLAGNYVPVSGMVFRRETAIGLGLFEPGLHGVEDRDFILRMARAGRFAYCPIVASRKRIHRDNISGPKNHLATAEGRFAVLLRARALVQDGPEEDRRLVERELDRAAFDLLYSASVTGLGALSRVAKNLRLNGHGKMTIHLRPWLRACWYQMTRPRELS